MKHSVVATAVAGALVAGLAWLPAPQAHAWNPCVPLDGSPLEITKRTNDSIGQKIETTRTYTWSDGVVYWTIKQGGGVVYNTGFGFGAVINAVVIPELDSDGSAPADPGEWVNVDTWHYHTRVLICEE